jgi:amino acid adenylation domain-containing protein
MLLGGFLGSLQRYPERTALYVDSRELTYRQLSREASAIACLLSGIGPDPSGVVGLLACDSTVAFAGVLAILAARSGFVPVNFLLPVKRVARMLTLSDTSTLVVGDEYAERLPELLAEMPGDWRIVLPQSADRPDWRRAYPRHRWYFRSDLAPEPPGLEALAAGAELAYVMFTSGSTGLPKGIWVAQRSVESYLGHVCREYAFTPEDRFSQAFPLTFDPAIHDMFACWASGAGLYCVPKRHRFLPGNFIRQFSLTCWFSVPSVITMMRQARALKPGLFPSLRLSLFVGEQLYAESARQWQAAAPHSRIDNVYGPTETTVVISNHRWSPAESAEIVPIGRVFSGQRYRILDPQGQPPPAGEPGELYLTGSQLTLGYRKDPDRHRESFVVLGNETWYRTGDLVTEHEGTLTFRGRRDSQLKIHGFRAELGEIDAVVRRVTGAAVAITIPYPVEDSRTDNIYTFVLDPADPFDPGAALRACAQELPAPLVPRLLWKIDELPLNANGKADRGRLTEYVRDRLAAKPQEQEKG